LLQDLKQRGLLDDTLVVFGGEFGRTTYGQGNITRETTDATNTRAALPPGWRAAASVAACTTARPTTSVKTS